MRVSTIAFALLGLRQVTAAPAPALEDNLLAPREYAPISARDNTIVQRDTVRETIMIKAKDATGLSGRDIHNLVPRDMENWKSAVMERLLKFEIPHEDAVKYNIPNDALVWKTGMTYERKKVNGTVEHIVVVYDVVGTDTVVGNDTKVCFTEATVTAWQHNIARVNLGMSFSWIDRKTGTLVPLFWTVDAFFTREITVVAGWENQPEAYIQPNGDVTACPAQTGSSLAPVNWNFNCWGNQCLPSKA